MEVIHAVVGINSDECRPDFISMLPTVFDHKLIECDLHVCMMGRSTNKLKHCIPEESENIMSIQSTAYNYSLTINTLLKQIATDYPFATVVITDGWTIMSPHQIIAKEFLGIDWEKEFITVPTMFDDSTNPLKILKNDSKFHSAYFSRIKRIEWQKKKNIYSPIVIAKVKHIVELECGLEEELFSEYSRLHLINQLKATGLEERISVKNKGLCLRKRRDTNNLEDRDLKNVAQFKKKTEHSIFIPSNYSVEWGDASKIGCMRRGKDLLPYWKLKRRAKINLYSMDDDVDGIETEEEDIGDITEITFKNGELEFDKNFRILLVVNSDTKALLNMTPLIKGIYKKYGSVDIVTNDVLNPAVSLIRNSMVDKVYKIDDFHNGMTNFCKYGPNIIKTTSSYDIKLPKDLDIIEPLNLSKYTAEKNYSVVDPCIEHVPEPYCNFTPYKGYINPQTTAIIISTCKNDKHTIWKDLSIVCSRLANDRANTILLLSMGGEITRLDPAQIERFKVRKNIKIINNVSDPVAAGILNTCSLVIVPSDSDAVHICWALKKNSIVIDHSSNSLDINRSDSMARVAVHSTKPKMPIPEIFEELINRL